MRLITSLTLFKVKLRIYQLKRQKYCPPTCKICSITYFCDKTAQNVAQIFSELGKNLNKHCLHAKYINGIPCDLHHHYLDIETTQSFLDNSSGPQSNAITHKFMTWIWSLFCLQMSSHVHINSVTLE